MKIASIVVNRNDGYKDFKRGIIHFKLMDETFDEINYIDVKGVRSEGNALRVNFKAHNNPKKKVTHYLFIQPLNGLHARFCWFAHKEVSKWVMVMSTYTECYELEIQKHN